MTTIIEDHGYPLIWFGKEDIVTEARTEAGRALAEDMGRYWQMVKESTTHGWCPPQAPNVDILAIEAEAATLALADVAGLVETAKDAAMAEKHTTNEDVDNDSYQVGVGAGIASMYRAVLALLDGD